MVSKLRKIIEKKKMVVLKKSHREVFGLSLEA